MQKSHCDFYSSDRLKDEQQSIKLRPLSLVLLNQNSAKSDFHLLILLLKVILANIIGFRNVLLCSTVPCTFLKCWDAVAGKVNVLKYYCLICVVFNVDKKNLRPVRCANMRLLTE